MASFKLVSEWYPVGSTVQVHPASGRVDGAPPSTAQVTSAVVAADGSVTFTGLTDETPYVAYASVGGVHRYVNIKASRSGRLVQEGAGYSARALTNNTEYTPSTERPTHVAINPAIDVDKGEEGSIAIQMGDAGAPATLHTLNLKFADADATNAKNVKASFPFSIIVPAGKVYKLVTANTTGAPAFTLGSAQEMTL